MQIETGSINLYAEADGVKLVNVWLAEVGLTDEDIDRAEFAGDRVSCEVTDLSGKTLEEAAKASVEALQGVSIFRDTIYVMAVAAIGNGESTLRRGEKALRSAGLPDNIRVRHLDY